MTSIPDRYRALVSDRGFEFDPAQAELARKLDALSAKLKTYRAEPRPSAFARLMGLKAAEPRAASTSMGPSAAARPC